MGSSGGVWPASPPVCSTGGWPSAIVMMAAIILNLMIAAAVGVLVPFALHRMGRDPAQGSSVLLTFVTDSMGFFLFLGLAWFYL